MIHIHAACRKLRKIGCKCGTIGVMLRTKDFKVYYNKINLHLPTNFEFEISDSAFPLLEEMFNPNIVYRSVGINLENFNPTATEQMQLFIPEENSRKEKNEKLAESLDKLESKFGRNIVRTGFTNKEIPAKQDFITHGGS